MLRAGSLATSCLIQVPNSGVDELGQPIEGWTDFAAVKGAMLSLNGKEAIRAGAVTSSLEASIRIRYRTDINASMRVLVDGAAYGIKKVLPDFQRREFVDLVVEVVA